MNSLRRKKVLTKSKIYVTFVLPVFLVILAAKVARTYIHIKLRQFFARHSGVSESIGEDGHKRPRPVPIPAKPVETERVTPKKVD